MSKAYLFYNPLAGQGKAIEDLKLLEAILDADDLVYCDMTKGETYSHQLFSLTEDDCLVLCGGDGTLTSGRDFSRKGVPTIWDTAMKAIRSL